MHKKLTVALLVASFGALGAVLLSSGVLWTTQAAVADEDEDDSATSCYHLPDHATLTSILGGVVDAGGNEGLGNDMWATVVSRDGVVCAVARSGEDRGDQWPGSRVISAQKANTANAFSLPDGSIGVLPGLALSTANLYTAVQPGGSLFGLQHSNPVDPDVAYRGNARKYGQHNDPMVGRKIGGVNVFGGGLALYYTGVGDGGEPDTVLVGALGVSGDTSCTDHIIAWKVRDGLELDNVPTGVNPPGNDNIIFDLTNPFGHPECGFGEVPIANALPTDFPIGPNP